MAEENKTITQSLEEKIKARAHIYVEDTFKSPTAYEFLTYETAMLIGASIAIETQIVSYMASVGRTSGDIPSLAPQMSDEDAAAWLDAHVEHIRGAGYLHRELSR